MAFPSSFRTFVAVLFLNVLVVVVCSALGFDLLASRDLALLSCVFLLADQVDELRRNTLRARLADLRNEGQNDTR